MMAPITTSRCQGFRVYNTHAFLNLKFPYVQHACYQCKVASHLVPSDLILTSPESCKISARYQQLHVSIFSLKIDALLHLLTPCPLYFVYKLTRRDTLVIKSAFQPCNYFRERSLETIQFRLHKEAVYK